LSSGIAFPIKRVTVNLAPASIRKAGSGLELAIALALTSADDGLPEGVLDGVAVLGELGLDGAVRPVRGNTRARRRRRARRCGVRHRSRRQRGRGRRSSRAFTFGTRDHSASCSRV
jgi:predicted ATPase with chaperone activity